MVFERKAINYKMAGCREPLLVMASPTAISAQRRSFIRAELQDSPETNLTWDNGPDCDLNLLSSSKRGPIAELFSKPISISTLLCPRLQLTAGLFQEDGLAHSV